MNHEKEKKKLSFTKIKISTYPKYIFKNIDKQATDWKRRLQNISDERLAFRIY